MKISKPLLLIIAAAVTIGTVASCTKEKPTEKDKNKTEEKTVQPDSCPGCGMG